VGEGGPMGDRCVGAIEGEREQTGLGTEKKGIEEKPDRPTPSEPPEKAEEVREMMTQGNSSRCAEGGPDDCGKVEEVALGITPQQGEGIIKTGQKGDEPLTGSQGEIMHSSGSGETEGEEMDLREGRESISTGCLSVQKEDIRKEVSVDLTKQALLRSVRANYLGRMQALNRKSTANPDLLFTDTSTEWVDMTLAEMKELLRDLRNTSIVATTEPEGIGQLGADSWDQTAEISINFSSFAALGTYIQTPREELGEMLYTARSASFSDRTRWISLVGFGRRSAAQEILVLDRADEGENLPASLLCLVKKNGATSGENRRGKFRFRNMQGPAVHRLGMSNTHGRVPARIKLVWRRNASVAKMGNATGVDGKTKIILPLVIIRGEYFGDSIVRAMGRLRPSTTVLEQMLQTAAQAARKRDV